VHAAYADHARLADHDTMLAGDASPSELAALLGDCRSNLLGAHPLTRAGAGGGHHTPPFRGRRRRTYLRLIPAHLDSLAAPPPALRGACVVCTPTRPRSHLAAALWRQASGIPAVAAGNHSRAGPIGTR